MCCRWAVSGVWDFLTGGGICNGLYRWKRSGRLGVEDGEKNGPFILRLVCIGCVIHDFLRLEEYVTDDIVEIVAGD